MTIIKYILVGPNGKYLQEDGEFNVPIETAVQFLSLEEISTYIEQNLPVDSYTTVTYITKS
jgi:hypothetical protein